jgi:hypothetical protein
MSRGLVEKFSIFNLGRGYFETHVKGYIMRGYYLDELILLKNIHALLKSLFGIDMDYI